MRLSTDHHAAWLSDPGAHGLMGCTADCRCYHLLAPTLHSVGHFLSYERYPELVRRACLQASARPTRVLIAGTESEESVAAFLRAAAGLPLEVDVMDRCPTPLRRTLAAHEAGDPLLRTLQLSLPEQLPPVGLYDVVVADSFVKQFPPSLKRGILRILARALVPGGLLVLREYLGSLPLLLDDFWSQVEARLEAARWPVLASPSAWRVLRRELPELVRFMDRAGSTYPDIESLEAALAAAGLRLEHSYQPSERPYVITLSRSSG